MHHIRLIRNRSVKDWVPKEHFTEAETLRWEEAHQSSKHCLKIVENFQNNVPQLKTGYSDYHIRRKIWRTP